MILKWLPSGQLKTAETELTVQYAQLVNQIFVLTPTFNPASTVMTAQFGHYAPATMEFAPEAQPVILNGHAVNPNDEAQGFIYSAYLPSAFLQTAGLAGVSLTAQVDTQNGGAKQIFTSGIYSFMVSHNMQSGVVPVPNELQQYLQRVAVLEDNSINKSGTVKFVPTYRPADTDDNAPANIWAVKEYGATAYIDFFDGDGGTFSVCKNNATSMQVVSTGAGTQIDFTVDNATFVLTVTLKDKDGAVLSSQSVDLPLESVVVNVEYDEAAKEIVLTLQNGNMVRFSVADLVRGLVPDSRTINGKPLTADITLTAADVGALSEIPQATAAALGGIKTGATNDETARTYAVKTDGNGNGYVLVPASEGDQVRYTFESGTDGTFRVTESGGAASQTVSVGINNNSISNPNILINGDFSVNQRGGGTESNPYTTDGNKYAYDHWRFISFGRGSQWIGKTIIPNNANDGDNCQVRQYIEEYDKLWGKTLTLSMSVDGLEGSLTFTMPATEPSANTTLIGGRYLYVGATRADIYYESGKVFVCIHPPQGGSDITVNWVKLEYGSIATAFAPRLYAEDLFLCQRYYQLKSASYTFPSNGLDYAPPMRITAPTTGTVQINGVNYKYADAEIK